MTVENKQSLYLDRRATIKSLCFAIPPFVLAYTLPFHQQSFESDNYPEIQELVQSILSTKQDYYLGSLDRLSISSVVPVLYNNERQFNIYFPLIRKEYFDRALLTEALKEKGLFLGFAIDSNTNQNEIREPILAEWKTEVETPESDAMMGIVQAIRGEWDFSLLKKDLDYCRLHHEKMRIGPGLLWNEVLPDWLVNGVFTYEEMIDIVREHINAFISFLRDYEDVVDSIAVANEIIERNQERFDMGMVRMACGMLRQAFPNIKLSVNGFFLNGDGVHYEALEVAQELFNQGFVDRIDIQYHRTVGFNINGFREAIINLHQNSGHLRGVIPIIFSEVGILHPDDEEGRLLQAAMFIELIQLALDIEAKEVYIWGLMDPAWRGMVTLINQDKTLKPAVVKLYEYLINL